MQDKPELKYIYGPVPSWRLGRSLGVDLLSGAGKICNFDCVYCQLGRTNGCATARGCFVNAADIGRELELLPSEGIDYITFSGRGETTLADNLSAALKEVKNLRKEPVAVITNAALLSDEKVRQELRGFDCVVAKLDACYEEMFLKINRPAAGIKLSGIIDGFVSFRKEYRGRLAVQTMFLRRNAGFAEEFADLYSCIQPDEIQVNTPLRPCSEPPLEKDDIIRIAGIISGRLPGIEVRNVYDCPPPETEPLSSEETLKRRGKV